MKKYDYILVDWDGCIAKTLDSWLEAYRQACTRRGVYPEDKDIAHHLGDWEIGTRLGIKDFEEFNKEAVKEATILLKSVALYPGAKESLLRLHAQRKHLALVSSGSREIVQSGIAHNGIAQLFETIITGEDVTRHKPDPESLQLALTNIGGTKQESVIIGDSRKDLGAANNFGIDSVLVYPSEHDVFYNREELEAMNPTYIIEHLDELNALFD